jgi:hypothetical protein
MMKFGGQSSPKTRYTPRGHEVPTDCGSQASREGTQLRQEPWLEETSRTGAWAVANGDAYPDWY